VCSPECARGEGFEPRSIKLRTVNGIPAGNLPEGKGGVAMSVKAIVKNFSLRSIRVRCRAASFLPDHMKRLFLSNAG